MNTATTVTGIETAAEPVARRPNGSGADSGAASKPNGKTDATSQLRRSLRKKYRHVAAVHSESRPSCLSHDASATPSFLGFRNLMVIMLGESCSQTANVFPPTIR